MPAAAWVTTIAVAAAVASPAAASPQQRYASPIAHFVKRPCLSGMLSRDLKHCWPSSHAVRALLLLCMLCYPDVPDRLSALRRAAAALE